jgi:hypothetical protein
MAERHPQKPPTRDELAVTLAVNAASKPFNLAVLLVVFGGGLAVGASVPIALVLAVIVYTAAVARTMFDGDEAERVAAARRGARRREVAEARTARRLDIETLAPPIAAPVADARRTAGRIRDAIQRAELPYVEVGDAVDDLLGVVESSARRAQLLYEVLDEDPPATIERRIAQLDGAQKPQLVEALEGQLAVQRKVEVQLERFYDELERLTVELDTIRGTLVSLSASTDASNQQRLAADVRTLRDELGAVASGMSEAYEQGHTPD